MRTGTTAPAWNVVEDALFSITCTTCQARLVVRSEAAIGAILECPRCRSMVQVTPPPDWRPSQPVAETPTGPPLSGPASDRPEPTARSALLDPTRIVLGVAVLVVIGAVGMLWSLLPERAAPPSAATETETVAPGSGEDAEAAPETPPAADEVAKGSPSEPSAADDKLPSEAAPAAEETHSEEKTDAASSTETPAAPNATPQAGAAVAAPSPTPVAQPPAESAEEDSAVEVEKVPPPAVDVAARMADPIDAVAFKEMPLDRAVGVLAAMSSVPITLDIDALTHYGVAPREPISLKLDATTVGKALRAVAAEKRLAVTLDSGRVIVTSPADFRDALRKTRYAVADLAEDGATVADLAALVRTLVAPDSWRDAGGRGTLETEPGTLAVEQTDEVHRQVLDFCEKLRSARGKPLQSRDNPDRYSLTSRRQQARTLLDTPLSVNFHEPTPLAKILAYMAEAAHVEILVDHAALAAFETSDHVEASLTVAQKPLGVVLDELLCPLGLTSRVIDAQTIQVTTREAADERLELEFYPAKRLQEGRDPAASAALAERLKAEVAPSTWSSVGGRAELCVDGPSQCLIVLQSQPAQAAVQRVLESERQ